jgi:hypothetical protein
MANILPVNAVVSRFAPTSASGILTRAMPANRQPGHFRLGTALPYQMISPRCTLTGGLFPTTT